MSDIVVNYDQFGHNISFSPSTNRPHLFSLSQCSPESTLLLYFFVFGEIPEKVVVEDLGDTGKEVYVNVVFLKNPIDITTVAIQFPGKPVDVAGLRHLIKNHANPLSDLHVFRLSHTGPTPPRR